MKAQMNMKKHLLLAAILFYAVLPSWGAGTNGMQLKQWVEQCLPGARLLPEPPAKPRTLLSASGEPLDLMSALRENSKTKKGAGYLLTPTMHYLSRQHLPAPTADAAVGLIQLLHVLTRGPSFVRMNKYSAFPVDGGWVVTVEHNYANDPQKAPAIPPYELLVDASQSVAQIQERSFSFLGSPVVYDRTVRTVYEREFKLNGGIHYQATVERELAKEWETERARKAVKK